MKSTLAILAALAIGAGSLKPMILLEIAAAIKPIRTSIQNQAEFNRRNFEFEQESIGSRTSAVKAKRTVLPHYENRLNGSTIYFE